jgi:sugar phosphate isomerase/epimerase
MQDVREVVHLNAPFRMLKASHLERFIQNGFHPEIGFDAQVLDECSLDDFRRVSERLREHGLTATFHFPFMDLSPGSPESAIRELTLRRFRQVLPIIPLFRPKVAVCHTGYDRRRYGFMRKSWLDRSTEVWSDLGKALAEEGCLLVLENVYEEGPQEMAELLESLRAFGVGFCLDTGHQAAFSRAPMTEWIKGLSSYIRHLHLHDNAGFCDDHLALGRGTVDFEAFFRELKRANVHPAITLEPHREEDVLPSLRVLGELWPW